ncbi:MULTISPECIES: IucA/IucC family protein [Bacteria]|uniref:IucA/IucC family protein n=1 Tax=Bacteria TaxID=2 RepID=UPI003C7C1763
MTAPSPRTATPPETAAHLTPGALDRAQRHLVAKAVAEFSHERLITPEPCDDGWRLLVPAGDVEYRFAAARLTLEHWVVDEDSIRRIVDGHDAAPDVQELILELQPLLGLSDELLPIYLEELASTLAGAMFKIARGGPTAQALADADFQTVETAMTEGHPVFVANNGRIGFGVSDHAAFAPESGRPFRMVWLAARRSVSHLALGAGLDAETLLRGELDSAERARFASRLRDLGEDPADFHLLPVHPWQWENRVTITFAPDLARRDLVLIGESEDEYRAQQSVRTMFNASHPERHYVKTALAVQNMGFLRGLSPAYMRVTPAINDWAADLVAGDSTLRDAGFRLLRERASIGYVGDVYHRTPEPSAHRKMLAALWRESPVPLVSGSQRLATMASLLHRDAAGASVATALVRASGLPAAEWVGACLHAYLRPIVHCLLAHDLAFMPHGENLILILDEHVPTGVFMKDIGEEVMLLADRAVPEEIRRIISPVDDEEKALAIFTDVFDGVLRHLAGILHLDGTLPETEFWRLVAETIDRHAAEHPDLDSLVDLRADAFAHSCLNRLQLRNTLRMVDIANQSASLIYAGSLENPIGRSRIDPSAATSVFTPAAASALPSAPVSAGG